METLRYGMLGCGMMGQEHLRNIALLPNAYVANIYEPDAGMLQQALTLAPQAKVADSMQALLEDVNIDCLVITSPNFCHAEQLCAIASTRVMPVLLEKPVCTERADIERLLTLPQAFRDKVWVAMEYRYMPPIAFLAQQVFAAETTANAIGQTVMLSIREHRFPFLKKVNHWNRFNRYSGGTLVEKCCHFFDLMRFILREKPKRIFASASIALNHLDERYADGVPDILDNAYVIVEFEAGKRAMLELCMFAEGSLYQEEISVVGHQGKVECFVPGPARFWPKELGDLPEPKVVLSMRQPKSQQHIPVPIDAVALAAGDHNGATLYQHQKFNALAQSKQLAEVSLTDGLIAVMMGLAAQQSAKSGTAIELQSGEFDLTKLL